MLPAEVGRLTTKQGRFVEEFLVDCNATQSAIRAGYAPKTAQQGGARLYRNVKIRAAIDTAMEARSQRVGIDQNWVLKRLKKTYRSAKEDGQYSAANRSLELVGKHIGMFSDRVIHEGGEKPIQIQTVELDLSKGD